MVVRYITTTPAGFVAKFVYWEAFACKSLATNILREFGSSRTRDRRRG